MAFNSFMKIFQPKDRVFYTLFEEVVNTVAEMSELLKKLIIENERDKRFSILSEIEAKAPLRRTTTPEEVGDTALFLFSDLSRGITGENIHVDSGYHIL